MVSDKLIRIIIKVVDLTDQGKLSWTQAQDPMTYFCDINGMKVQIQMIDSSQYPDSHDALFSIKNSAGSVVESLIDTEIEGTLAFGELPFPYLSGLFDKARRNALGIDTQLDDLLKELDNKDWE